MIFMPMGVTTRTTGYLVTTAAYFAITSVARTEPCRFLPWSASRPKQGALHFVEEF